VYIVRSCKFKCSFEAAKRSFYRTANSIFGGDAENAGLENPGPNDRGIIEPMRYCVKIRRIASEETILQLIRSKCIPSVIRS